MYCSYLTLFCPRRWFAAFLAGSLLLFAGCPQTRDGDVVQLNAALFTGDRFVVAGGLREYEEDEFAPYNTLAVLAASSDGETWEPHLPDVWTEWTAVAAGDARYVAVSGCVEDNGAVAISEGGSTWTAYTGLPDLCFHSAAVRDGRFFAAQHPGGLFESVDGVIWDEVERTLDEGSGPAPWTGELDGIVRDRGIFVAWWGGGVATSTDGAAWIPHTVDCAGGTCGDIERVIALEDRFAALATRDSDAGDPIPYLSTSDDGAAWSGAEVPAPLVAVALGDGVYAAASAEHLYWSEDGADWKRGDKTAWDQMRTDIAYGDGLFLATGENTLLSSDDGKAWSEIEVTP